MAPNVRAIGASQSVPTPKTHELFRVVVRLAVGAPGLKLPVPMAPTAPEPFVPEVSTPVKLITVIEQPTLLDRVAVTETLVNGTLAKARQISAGPNCAFALTTGTQVSPPPVTFVIVPLRSSLEIKASNNSLPDVVENVEVVTVELAVFLSPQAVVSIAIPAAI